MPRPSRHPQEAIAKRKADSAQKRDAARSAFLEMAAEAFVPISVRTVASRAGIDESTIRKRMPDLRSEIERAASLQRGLARTARPVRSFEQQTEQDLRSQLDHKTRSLTAARLRIRTLESALGSGSSVAEIDASQAAELETLRAEKGRLTSDLVHARNSNEKLSAQLHDALAAQAAAAELSRDYLRKLNDTSGELDAAQRTIKDLRRRSR